jgi:predicted membrane protein (TIGR00267 family)
MVFCYNSRMESFPDPQAAAQGRIDAHVKERHGIGSVRTEVREAVFGVQDGLISTLGALTGIAAGTQNRDAVIVAGFVIIAVESLSMAAGSYLSSKSQREYLQRLLKEEEEEIARNPEGERKELRDMYRARGFTEPEIDIIANRIMSNPKLLLEDMAHKELGITMTDLEEPLSNALVMGVAYVLGGSVPVLFYVLLPLSAALPVSVAGTLLALFLFGGLKGRFVNQSWWRSGLEMLTVAGLAALAGFLIGRAVDQWVLHP